MRGDIVENEWVWQTDHRTGKQFLRQMPKQQYRIRIRHILYLIIFLVGPVLCGSLLQIWRLQ